MIFPYSAVEPAVMMTTWSIAFWLIDVVDRPVRGSCLREPVDEVGDLSARPPRTWSRAIRALMSAVLRSWLIVWETTPAWRLAASW